MRKTFVILLFCLSLSMAIAGFTNKTAFVNANKTVTLTKITNNIWVHTTYGVYKGNSTPSNGLVIITTKGLVLIDTAWNDSETEDLIQLCKERFNKNIVLALITHAHSDRIGGISTLLKHKITVKSTKLTADKAKKLGYDKPKGVLKASTTINIGKTKLEAYFPGEGHTSDNITVWLPNEKVLFGGCLVKSSQSTDLGNVQDANVKEWPHSVARLIAKYPDAKIVIPGHGDWGGNTLLKHTLELFKK